MYSIHYLIFFFFFFNDTATTEIYTLSLHDALPICPRFSVRRQARAFPERRAGAFAVCQYACATSSRDRKSTRLNSSHANISYAVFCLKKKKKHDLNDVVDADNAFAQLQNPHVCRAQ